MEFGINHPLSQNNDNGNNSANKGLLTGVLTGVLLYSFTGNPVMVALGLLIGLMLGTGQKRK